ncbi:MAG TPA: class I SAM-dependent methyltransferase [Stenotrophomonas sp.]|jgi:SAM-dependent methyltransferase
MSRPDPVALDSQERFSNRVADYVRYRPGYPPQLIEWIHGPLGVAPDARVADIGAGTGISSRIFLQAGHPVIAVEPNAPMRLAAERWLADAPGFQAVAGNAESTTLDTASVDLVVAAQAFHWFDTEAVRGEWKRILRPGGRVVVFWNSRLLEATAFLADYEALLHQFGTDYQAVAERYQDDATMRAWFGEGFIAQENFPNVQRMDFDSLRGRLLSSSYAPAEGHPRHAPMLAALRALFDRHAVDGHVEFAYLTRAFAGTLS